MNSARFGKLLRDYRLGAGLSQESLAERAAMSVNGISALERGTNQTPQRKTLELLVKALDLDAQNALVLEEAASRPSRTSSRRTGKTLEDLPRSVSPFFGRAEAIVTIAGLVHDLPLVTLTGPGGIGKTRLALRVVEELAHHFADGARFIDLAPVRGPESVLRAILDGGGIKASADEPALARILKALRNADMLLLIDNCEHLVGAVAPVVQALIQTCHGIRIVATSRQPLNVPGEQVFRVPPLDLDAAINLFTERAKRGAAQPPSSPADRDTIARIVTRLDGIALAVELAAARTNVLALPELERALSERLSILTGGSQIVLPRQQTMRAAIDWSYELLSSYERRTFTHLSVFPGSFSLDAAVAVCGDASSGKWQVFEALSSLVDKSLLSSEPEGGVQRYRLLETTLAYAIEQLNGHGDAKSLLRRHAAHYGGVAEAAASAFGFAGSTMGWARSLEPDLENFRTALDWMLRDGNDLAGGAQLLWNLQEFWAAQGLAAEACRRARDVLDLKPNLPKPLLAALWVTIARMRQELFSHPAGMLEAATIARNLYEDSADRRGLALAIRQQAVAHMRLGRHSQARAEFTRSLEIYGELNDRRMTARGLGYLASLLQVEGEHAEARTTLLKVIEITRAVGDDRMLPNVCMNLSEAEFALGDNASAVEHAQENLTNEILQKSCDMTATQEANLSAYLLALGRLDDSRSMALASIDDAVGAFVAVPLQHLAASIARSDPDYAAKMLGYVQQSFDVNGFCRQYTEQYTYDYLTRQLREVLEDGALAMYVAEGASMTRDQVLALANEAAESAYAT